MLAEVCTNRGSDVQDNLLVEKMGRGRPEQFSINELKVRRSVGELVIRLRAHTAMSSWQNACASVPVHDQQLTPLSWREKSRFFNAFGRPVSTSAREWM